MARKKATKRDTTVRRSLFGCWLTIFRGANAKSDSSNSNPNPPSSSLPPRHLPSSRRWGRKTPDRRTRRTYANRPTPPAHTPLPLPTPSLSRPAPPPPTAPIPPPTDDRLHRGMEEQQRISTGHRNRTDALEQTLARERAEWRAERGRAQETITRLESELEEARATSAATRQADREALATQIERGNQESRRVGLPRPALSLIPSECVLSIH